MRPVLGFVALTAAASAHLQWVFHGDRSLDSQVRASTPRADWNRAYLVSSSCAPVMQGNTGTTCSPAECTCHLVSWSAHSSSKIFSRISKGSLSKKGDAVWSSAVAAMSDRSWAMQARELGRFYGA